MGLSRVIYLEANRLFFSVLKRGKYLECFFVMFAAWGCSPVEAKHG